MRASCGHLCQGHLLQATGPETIALPLAHACFLACLMEVIMVCASWFFFVVAMG